MKKSSCVIKVLLSLTLVFTMGIALSGVVTADSNTDESANIEDTLNSGAHRTNYDAPRSGNVFGQVMGEFDDTDASLVLEQINGYRYEACLNGYPDPRNPSRALTLDDYVPLRWSNALEETAMVRAGEAELNFAHETITGESWQSRGFGLFYRYECISWNYSRNSMSFGLSSFYRERQAWIDTGVYDNAGHYVSMITPENTHIGIASIGHVTVAEFYSATSTSPTVNESRMNISAFNSQLIEIPVNKITGATIGFSSAYNRTDVLYPQDTAKLYALASLTVTGYSGVANPVHLVAQTWGSNNPEILTVDRLGNATAVAPGTAEVYCTIAGTTYTATITVGNNINPGWNTIDGKIYYLGSDRNFATGWQNIDGSWYYFGSDCSMQTGWLTLNSNKYYLLSDGKRASGWQEIESYWYYFNEDGIMQRYWIEVDGSKYYTDYNGRRLTGFRTINGVTYYFNEDGIMLTGWQDIGNYRYYFNEDGSRANGWTVLDGNTYYFNSNYGMYTEWRTIDGSRYYFGLDGIRVYGWQQISNYWYYFNDNGVMQTGWLDLDGHRYYLG